MRRKYGKRRGSFRARRRAVRRGGFNRRGRRRMRRGNRAPRPGKIGYRL